MVGRLGRPSLYQNDGAALTAATAAPLCNFLLRFHLNTKQKQRFSEVAEVVWPSRDYSCELRLQLMTETADMTQAAKTVQWSSGGNLSQVSG